MIVLEEALGWHILFHWLHREHILDRLSIVTILSCLYYNVLLVLLWHNLAILDFFLHCKGYLGGVCKGELLFKLTYGRRQYVSSIERTFHCALKSAIEVIILLLLLVRELHIALVQHMSHSHHRLFCLWLVFVSDIGSLLSVVV